MGRIREFSITLSGTKEVFYAGEDIKGYVTVHYDREKALKSMKLRLVGEISCVWTELATNPNNTDPATLIAYTSSDCVLDTTILLHKNSFDSDTDTYIQQPGKQLYDFVHHSAPGLPSSFEGAHGTIRYFLKATIEEGNGDLFHCKRAITVLTHLDTNDKLFIKQPGGEVSNVGGPPCCPTGWVYFRAYLDRAAYCPGESIYVTVHIENTSKHPIPSICIQLEKQETYKALCFDSESAQLEEKVNKTYIVSVRSPGVPAKEDFDIDDQALNIPVTEPSLKARLISVDYFVHVFLQVHKNANLRLMIPVTIGTVPFRGLKKKVGSKVSLQSQGNPPEFLPIVGARGLRIKEDGDGEYIFITDDYLPVYPCAT